MIATISLWIGGGCLGLGKPEWATAWFMVSVLAKLDHV